MDERTLSELLECSVCLEQLNADSRVLPCQHTFCRSCLEEIVRAKKELRCPECRMLIRCHINDLPTNLLLVKLLEGIKSSERSAANRNTALKRSARAARKLTYANVQPAIQASQVNETGITICSEAQFVALFSANDNPCAGAQGPSFQLPIMKTVLCNPTRCYALYNYKRAKEDELDLKKGEQYIVYEKCEDGWFRGCAAQKLDIIGYFPGNYVQEMRSTLDTNVIPMTPFVVTEMKNKSIDAVPMGADNLNSSGSSVGSSSGGLVVPVIHPIVSRHHSFPKTSPLAGTEYATRAAFRPSSMQLAHPRPITNITQAQSRHLMCSNSSGSSIRTTAGTTSTVATCSPTYVSPVFSTLPSNNDICPLQKVESKIGAEVPVSSTSEDHKVVLRVSSRDHKTRNHSARHSVNCSSMLSPEQGLDAEFMSGNTSKRGEKTEGKPSLLKRLSQVGLAIAHHRPRSAKNSDQSTMVETVSVQTPNDGRHSLPKMASLNRSNSLEMPESNDATVPESDIVAVQKSKVTGSLSIGRHKGKHYNQQRFLCVIPYPANSELELDLKVGDVVVVHKMSSDGWCRGTQLSTGRTGYFPASFVKSCQ